MKKILFLHPGKACLPEISAYKKYFSTVLKGYEFFNSSEICDYQMSDFDIVWRFMGTNFTSNKIPTIHEYASLSIGKFAKVKDKIKYLFNEKPELRIFLNQTISSVYSFKDKIPCVYRDMGIDEIFLRSYNEKREYDFVYLGNMEADRRVDLLLEKICEALKYRRILMIGKPNDDLFNRFKKCENIIFTGQVNYHEVPILASKAEYGINYIQNKYPYNLQTSTKLLEYVALELKIISTDYYWVREFENIHGLKLLKVRDDLSDFTEKRICDAEYGTSNVKIFTWNEILKKSNIEEYLKVL